MSRAFPLGPTGYPQRHPREVRAGGDGGFGWPRLFPATCHQHQCHHVSPHVPACAPTSPIVPLAWPAADPPHPPLASMPGVGMRCLCSVPWLPALTSWELGCRAGREGVGASFPSCLFSSTPGPPRECQRPAEWEPGSRVLAAAPGTPAGSPFRVPVGLSGPGHPRGGCYYLGLGRTG